MTNAPHLAPDRCYVCGGEKHDDTTAQGGHNFWSNADAAAHFEAEDQKTNVRYSNGTTTPEANYVAERRPY